MPKVKSTDQRPNYSNVGNRLCNILLEGMNFSFRDPLTFFIDDFVGSLELCITALIHFWGLGDSKNSLMMGLKRTPLKWGAKADT